MVSNYRYPLYRMRHKAKFGVPGETENAMGVTISGFKELFTLHYAKIQLTFNQRYGALGTSLQNKIIIAVRHNPKIKQPMFVKLSEDEKYKIVDISTNNDDYISYDLLTLEKTDKVGGQNG